MKTIKLFITLVLAALACSNEMSQADFLDDFEDPCSVNNYTGTNSYGNGGSFTISGGKLKIKTGTDNTFSVMTTDSVAFLIGDTLSLDVPEVSGSEGVFMMCSTSAAQPNSSTTFGFRFRRGLGQVRIDLYPGQATAYSPDPCSGKPALLIVKRTSNDDFEYFISIEGTVYPLGSFSLSPLADFSNLHIGAQAYAWSGDTTFTFDNLKISKSCGYWGYNSADINRDCYTDFNDFAIFAAGWLECTMPFEPGCAEYGAQPFSIVILPDTQIYSQNNPNLIPQHKSSRKEIFTQMTNWIAQNTGALNIKFVLHMGDIVNNDSEPNQWSNAYEAMSILDDVNMPYSLAVGNHDMDSSTRNTTNFNSIFPYTRFENKSWYGGRMEDTSQDEFEPVNDYDNAFHYFQAAGMDFLVLTLEAGPTDKMLAWADSVISSHPNHRVILATHSYMNPEDKLDVCYWLPGICCTTSNEPNCSNTGEQVWQKLVRKHENIAFVFSGHQNPNSSRRGFLASMGDHYNIVYQFLCAEWYDGWLRILTFVPQENRIYMKTYSPWRPEDANQQDGTYPFSLPAYNTDQFHQYDLYYGMD